MSPLPTDRTRLAVPYYGSLLHPAYGLSRLFYFGLVDLSAGMLVDMEVAIWNPEETTDLAAWLKSHQVSGLLAQDTPAPYVGSLRQKGIWVEGECEGDPRELINRWLRHQVAGRDERSMLSTQHG